MGTQAVVSIVRGGEVLVKVVAGCGGGEAPELAEALRARPDLNDAESVYGLAVSRGFACVTCLVVLDKDKAIYQDDGEELDYAYRETFGKPRWNPRWDNGKAAYVEIVER